MTAPSSREDELAENIELVTCGQLTVGQVSELVELFAEDRRRQQEQFYERFKDGLLDLFGEGMEINGSDYYSKHQIMEVARKAAGLDQEKGIQISKEEYVKLAKEVEKIKESER